LLFSCICLFAVTLTNSIFLTQIGYFGALILAVTRSIVSGKRFQKTGLEGAFLIFIIAEILCTILSVQPAAAAILTMKRILLIPVVYTILYSSDDIGTVKKIFFLYVAGAVVTAATYLAFAYEHLIHNLYVMHTNGPSPFNHVMSAGGLLAMLSVMLFAFVIDRKIHGQYRWLVSTAFLIAVTALIASYTRAAWLGAAAGMIGVSVLENRWWALAAVTVIIAGCAFLIEGKSDVYVYRYSDSGITQTNRISTKGTAYTVISSDNALMISDYEDGIVRIGKDGTLSNFPLPAPVISCVRWQDSLFVASLIDSRLILLGENRNKGLTILKEFSSPGLLRTIAVANGFLYTLDKDSGVTVYRKPLNLADTIRCPETAGFQNMGVTEQFLTLSSFDDTVSVYTVVHGIPDREIFRRHPDSPVTSVFTIGNNLYIGTIASLERYHIDSTGVLFREKRGELGGIVDCSIHHSAAILAGAAGLILSIDSRDAPLHVLRIHSLDFLPKKVYGNGEQIFLIDRQRNRVLSIADPDYPTNYQRLRIWETGLRIFRAYPIFGIGDIDVAGMYAQFKKPYEKENFGHLHNNYIQFLVIYGLVGTLAVLFLLGATLYTEIQIFRLVRQQSVISPIVLGAAGSTIAFLVNGLGEWNFGDQETMTMIWFLLGISLAVRKYGLFQKTRQVKVKIKIKVKQNRVISTLISTLILI
jgi:hypothetical protein